MQSWSTGLQSCAAIMCSSAPFRSGPAAQMKAQLETQVQTLTNEFQERMKMVEMQMVQLQQMMMPDGTPNPQAVEQQQLLYTQVRGRMIHRLLDESAAVPSQTFGPGNELPQ